MNRAERLVGLLAARRPEPTMTVARSVADVLDDHVVFEVESIDRMYLNVWQPPLAYGGGVEGFFVGHRGYHYAYNARLCINGHEWAERQAAKAGIGHTGLDNGFATCDDPVASAFNDADRAASYR